jgi:hypothetical protein
MPKEQWPQDPNDLNDILQDWHPEFGDRRQELVLIGTRMNEALIRQKLDQCLLTNDEMNDGPMAWRDFQDPLPR